MMKKILSAAVLSALLAFSAFAQHTKAEHMSDVRNMNYVYRPYPDTEVAVSPAPKGYKPFYISSIARHGSRNLSDEPAYTKVTSMLQRGQEQGLLTPEGESMLTDYLKLKEYADMRWGHLVPRGEREHRHIIDRMYAHYPEVFSTKGGRQVRVDASSTTVIRTIMSMSYALDELKTLNPSIETTRASDERTQLALYTMPNTNVIDKTTKAYRKSAGNADPSRILALFFKDYSFLTKKEQTDFLVDAWRLGNAGDMVSEELGIDYFRYLEPTDVFEIWKMRNLYMFYTHGPSVKYGAQVRQDMIPMLSDFINGADLAVSGDSSAAAATMRFAHDIHIMPLANAMGMKGWSEEEKDEEHVYETWADYIISPMAANIQLVFFRSAKEDKRAAKAGEQPVVLVKVMLNEHEIGLNGVETDIFPFYNWADVRSHWMEMITEWAEVESLATSGKMEIHD